MLPRVSAALAKFIAPITISEKQSSVHADERKPFERFKPRKESSSERQGQQDPQEPPAAPVIPLRATHEKPAEPAPQPESPPAAPSGLTSAFLQITSALQSQRGTLLRWLGGGAYQAAARTQKKNGRCRKGTILDQKAE